ncbi:MAG: two-component regulator propeller domain-containing protein [Pyrinomonadaceae bacterium]
MSKKLLLCLCLYLGIAGVNAQYRIDQWTADDGLPQNSVYGITQTRDGYLWLATVDGLARFDGVRFTIFNKSNSPGITNNRFTNLFETEGGDLWAGTEESGVTRYHQGRFASYGVEQGLISPGGSLVSGDAEGNRLIVSRNFQVYRFADGNFSAFDPETDAPPVAPIVQPESIRVFCFYDSDKEQTACLVNGQSLRFSQADGLPSFRIINSVQDTHGTLWLLTSDAGLVHLENGKVANVYTKQDGLPEIPLFLVSGARLNLLSKDRQGALWFTDLNTMRNERLTRHLPTTLTEIIAGYEDSEGNIWLGTTRNGLFRIRKQVITAYSKADGLLDNNVYPVYEDHRGVVWVGTTNGVFKHQGGVFALVKSSKGFYVTAIGEDATGRLLVSSNGALYVFNEDQFVPIYKNSSGTNYAIHADHDGTLWVGGEGGLVRFKDGTAATYTTQNGLAGNDVKAIIDDKNGGMWIGAYGGLTHYQNGQFTSWTEKDGLPSRTVRGLYLDADGTLWIGSYDGGLARFKDGAFTHYDTKIGLFNDGAFQILEDPNSNFWVSSNRGIYRVSRNELNEFAEGKRKTITSVAYGKSDGMLNVECNGGRWPGGIKTRDGRLWFPTQDGVAVIDPEKMKVNAKLPPVVIESVKIDNTLSEPLALAGVRAVAGSPPANAGGSDFIINPDQQNFEISYTALSFINSENLRFKYKLEGLDSEWTDAANRRTAYFSHVPPGEYTFRVIAANSDNVWNEQGARLKIVVLPPFYRTWWFLTLVVLGVGAAAYLLFRRHISQIEIKHAEEIAFSRRLIDSQEQERKRFAAEMHDGLGQSLVIIKNRASLSLKQSDKKEAMIDHLENISATASHALNEAKEIAFNLRPHLLDRLGLTKTIESMLDKVFSAGGIEFDAEIDMIDGVLEKDSEILLYRIVQECANNIVKHSQAQKAFLRMERDDNNLTVTISDNGRGFDQRADGNDLSKRSFGLVGIAERTRLLAGKLNIDSKPGEGTNISIIIDLRNNAI